MRLALMLGIAACTIAADRTAGAEPPAFEAPYYVSPFRRITGSHFAAGDINHDGTPDLVVQYFGGLECHLGRPDGRLLRAFHTTGGVPYDRASDFVPFVLGDVNQDGHLDVILPNVAVALGNGDGTFQPGYDVSFEDTPDDPVAPLFTDVTGDGLNDVAMITGSGSPAFRAGTSGGGLDSLVQFNDDATAIAVGSLDGDALPDIAWSHGNATDAFASFGIYRNLGSGAFERYETIDGYGGRVHIADWNGDGLGDLAVGDDLFLGNGLGGFVRSGPAPFAVEAVADLDHDGHADIVGLGSCAILWASVASDGTAATVHRIPSARLVQEVHVVDFAGDGWPELVATMGNGRSLVVHPNHPGTGFLVPPLHAVGSSPVDALVLDANGDDAPDLAVAIRGERRLSILLNDGSGDFVPGGSIETAAGILKLASADLEADGTVEIVAVCDSAGMISIVTVGSGGALVNRRDVAVGPEPVAIQLGDLDDDDQLEIIVSLRTTPSLTVVASPFTGPSSVQAVNGWMGHGGPLAWVDASGDPQEDLIAAMDDGNWWQFPSDATLAVLQGEGGSGFLVTSGPITNRVAAMASDDRDGDGTRDVLIGLCAMDSGQVTQTELVLWSRNAASSLEQEWSTLDPELQDRRATSTKPTGLALADLDGDGDREALACDPVAGAVFLLAEDDAAPGHLGHGFGVGGGASALAVADFDGDGTLDVAVSCADENAIVVLKGTQAPPPVAVEAPAAPGLSLRAPALVRTSRAISVSFSLESHTTAKLELFDLAGRRLDSREVGSLGAGAHSATLGTGAPLPTGLYVVRLSSAGRSVSGRSVILR